MAETDYTNAHRLILQNFMCHPVMLNIDLQEKIRKLRLQTNDNTSIDTRRFIADINAKIRNHGLQIQSGTCEVTQRTYYVLVHTKQDAISKCMKYYTSTEQVFLRKILDEIFSSNKGFASSIACINFNNQISKSFSKTDASDALNRFIQHGWLASEKGQIYVGIRGRLELEPYFKVEYGDYLSSCSLCKQIILNGYTCKDCKNKFHDSCIQKYFLAHKRDPFCPNCKMVWSDVKISEDLSSDFDSISLDDTNVPSTSESSQPSTSGRTQRNGMRNSSEFDSGDDSQMPNRKRSRRNLTDVSYIKGD